MSILRRLEATLSLAAQCELEASRTVDEVKRKNYRVMAIFYKGLADDLRSDLARSAEGNNHNLS